ncbi:type II secretion system F family protein [Dyella solisilvae]|uniref:Type II secretion system F family protein n=1 Tax=Dyella solisilvae TaxID=1920168 RepID=A0A370K7A6_9GAMM|nr:type II secretion system F family protein [Dyella solisilvae]RDI98525.1 type II secretion system F family protein [Dyella solisilvae]
MSLALYLIVGSCGICIAVIAYVLFAGYFKDRGDVRTYSDPLPLALRLLWPVVLAVVPKVAPRLKPSLLERTHRQLQSAGLEFIMRPEEFHALRMVSGACGMAMLLSVMIMLDKIAFGPMSLALLVGGGCGYFYPNLWLKEQREKRRRSVIKDLPIYLDFITLSVEAGLNVTGAIEQAGLKGPPGALSSEFGRLQRELRAGLPRSDALKRMGERMGIPQVSGLVGALIQADRVGASLGDALRAQADQRRQERFQRAEKLGLEAPVKMMLPLVMFFFPQVFIVLAYFIYSKMKQEGVL